MTDYQPAPVEKPEHRSNLRSYLGREYFIAKRKFKWMTSGYRYVRRPHRKQGEKDCPAFSLIKHRSMLLRPLKDVDMYLQHNKVKNLSLAIQHINGVTIRPGERMSVWKLVGRPSKRKGYLDGLVLHNGQTGKGIGGGLCQLGNLLYWMALHTDLKITQRWRHSFDVFPDVNRTIPFACGATLSYNYIDLEILNATDSTYRILLWLDEDYLNGEIICSDPPTCKYEVVETDHSIRLQWWGGYTRHNRIWKKRTSLIDNSVTQELVAENHAIMMYNPLLPPPKEDN